MRAALVALALGVAGVAAAQTMNGPVQQGSTLATGGEAPSGETPTPDPFGSNPSAPFGAQTPITGLGDDSPLVPRPVPGGESLSERARLDALPQVQTVPAWPSDRDADGAEALAPASYPRGELIAMGAGLVQNAGNSCITCHGVRGEGDGGTIPRIAGLPAWYTAKQLHSYAEGTRENAAMQSVVGTLSPQDRLDVARYYSAIEAPPTRALPATDRELLAHGAILALRGQQARAIPACSNCHATDGAGLPPAVPYLAGQSASYITAQLDAWVAGTRINDEGAVMRAIATRMTPRDREAVGLYFQSLGLAP